MGKLVKRILPFLIAVAVVSLCALPLLAADITIGAGAKDADIPVGEILEKRTETSKTYYLGNSRYALDSYIGAIHYKDNYTDSKEPWKDIDLTWKGNRITRAPYELTLEGNKATIEDKKTGEVSTIELLEIGGIPILPQAWERSKGLARALGTGLEIVAGNGSVSFTRILKSDEAAVEAKYRVTGNIPLRVRASDTEGELPVEWTLKDEILTETLKPDQPVKYLVRIDPTLEPQVGASADDGFIQGTNSFYGASSNTQVGYYSYAEEWDKHSWFRWTGITITPGITISVSYIKCYAFDDSLGTPLMKIYGVDEDNPAAPTTHGEFDADPLTNASVDWDGAWVTGNWYQSGSLNSIFQELLDSYTISNDAMMVQIKNDGGANNQIQRPAAWDWSDNTYGAILHIEWTEGVVAPTVTTQVASVIEATTATGNGTITATGGENATIHGIEWDIDTGAPYANDVHTHGDFGVGAFEDYLTGLPTGTTIYCRSYATNTAGTGYGGEVNFLTKPAAPTNVAATENQSAKVVVTWTKSTGATGYKVYEGVNLLDTLGDVATFDHTTGDAPTITAGSVVATDGTETAHVALSLSGTSVANGTTYTYKVVALNATGDSIDSATDTGYRLASALTYQWNRSSGDADADYTPIGGATASTYEDTAAPAGSIDSAGTVTASDGTQFAHVVLSLVGESTTDGAGRYYTCTLVSTDADNTPQTAAANRGYRGVGAITYQWQRSAADSDANYSNIDGATTDPYNDTDGVVTPDGRYYQCIVSSVDASNTPQTSDNDRGYKSIAPLPGAPTDFTLTLSDSTISVGWTKGTFAATTVVRRQAERYPVDITDGVEAYNGAGVSFNDTGLNVEDNEYFYRAWSHNDTGYSEDYAEGLIGGKGMLFIGLIVLALGLTWFQTRIRGPALVVMTLIAMAMWGAMGAVLWTSPGVIGFPASGTNWSEYISYVFLGLIIVPLVVLMQKNVGTTKSRRDASGRVFSETGETTKFRWQFGKKKPTALERQAEYKEMLRGKTGRK